MLHIILLVFKIIGIVLLCILGTLLLAIFCALFVPVRYRIEVAGKEGDGSPPVTAYVKVTWLLHIVNVLMRYPAEVILRIRLFVFTLFRIPEKEKKRKEKKAKHPDRRRNQTKEAEEETGQAETPIEIAGTDEAHKADASAKKAPTEERSTEEIKNPLIAKIKGFIGKIRHLIAKIKAVFENIQYTIRKFCDKIKSVLDNIEYYREVLESEPFRQSMSLCQKELGAVLRGLKPDRFEADFTVGMEDPAATGQILAIWGMLYPLIGQHVRMTGDFESERIRIEGRMYVRGKVRMFTFLKAAAKIYFNKNLRTVIKLLKKEAVSW